MTRRDFVLIAETLNASKPPDVERDALRQWLATVRRFAGALATTNPGFKRETFMRACGAGEG